MINICAQVWGEGNGDHLHQQGERRERSAGSEGASYGEQATGE